MKKHLLLITFLLLGILNFAQADNKNPLALFQNPATKGELQVYPNPATNFIKISDNQNVEKIVIFNLVGSKMKTFKAMKGEKYFVGDLPKGIYLIQLLGKQNKILRTQRVSKR